jgi:uncharacterized protein YybS (DUF2232 family)
MYNRTMNTKSIVEAGLNAALVVAIMLMNAYVPAFSLIGTFLLPIPITILYIRYDLKSTLGAIFVSAVLVALLVGPITALHSSVVYGLSGIALGYCLKKRKKISATLGILTIASAIGTAFSYYVFGYLISNKGIRGLLQQTVDAMHTSKTMVIDMYTKMGVDTAQFEPLLKAFDLYTVETLLLFLPAMLILGGFFSAYLNFIISKGILKRFKYELPQMTPFTQVYFDNRIGALLIIIICIGVILTAQGIKLGGYLSTSGIMVLSFAFVVIGVAVVGYFLKNKYHMAKGFIILIIGFAIMSQLGSIFIFIGIADMIIDFRKVDPNRLLKKK